MMQDALSQLRQEAGDLVRKVEDDPKGRLHLREAFYRRYGWGRKGEFGFGNSELAFLRWEIRRGVLNSPDDLSRPGSPWWRNVNARFIYYSELAGLIREQAPDLTGLEPPTQFWLDYMADPNEQTWYRAHNASILKGYFDFRELAATESKPERVFINMVLYRLLYAQSDAEGVSLGLLGKLLSNPRLPSVDLMVHLPAFYPEHYPLSREDIINILHRGHSLGDEFAKILDEDLIIPHLHRLYQEAADWNSTPGLPKFLRNGAPVYPELAEAPTGTKYLVHSTKRFWQFLRFLVLHLFPHQ